MKGVVLSHHADIQLKMAELVITESDTCWLVLFKVSHSIVMMIQTVLLNAIRLVMVERSCLTSGAVFMSRS